MKKLKTVSSILVGILIFNSGMGLVQAASQQPQQVVIEEKQENKEKPIPKVEDSSHVLNYHDIDFQVPSFKNEQSSISPIQLAPLPQSYSSANITGLPNMLNVMNNYATPVKNQYSGTCWVHAAICGAETDRIINGSADIATLDYDEYKLAYFNYNRPLDPIGLTQGDATNVRKQENTIPEYLSVGGNLGVVMTEFANWITPSDDNAEFDYIDTLPTTDLTRYAYQQDAAHLENAYMLAMPNMTAPGYENDMNAVKELIRKNGSASISYYAQKIESSDQLYYNCPNALSANHSVAVVGWNDNIDADKFSNRPAGNGAWIVRNSWGPYNSMGGYFYLSYYDKSISNVAYIWEFGSSDNYENNYQYDGSGNFTSSYQENNQICGANTFVADSDENLKAIGLYTNNLNVHYTIDIYTGLGAESLPTAGTKVMTKSDILTYSGYHTIKLDTSVPIKEGERYAIVLTLAKAGEGINLVCDMNADFNWMSCVSQAMHYQSYQGNNSNNLSDLNAGNTSYQDGRNVRIKAFTDEQVPVTGVSLNKSQIEINRGAAFQLVATVLPAGSQQKVKWTSSDTAIADINELGLINAKAVGKTIITAKTLNGKFSSACEVTVKTIPVKGISLGQTSLSMGIGNTVQLKATLIPSNALNQNVSWSSNNAAVASVEQNGMIKANHDGTAMITVTSEDGSYQATCEVQVYNQEQWYQNAEGKWLYYVDGLPVKNTWIVGMNGDSELRYVDENGIMVINQFIFDGTYTYFMMVDGSPMKDRITYHPDGEHIIYFDEYGHEVFSNFQYSKALNHIYYFDSQGYMYKNQITFSNGNTYYLNGNGEMEQNGWFSFVNGRDYGFANKNGSLMCNGFSYDPWGRVVFYHWNGMVARGLITDGQWYYLMDELDGHLVGQFR
ncbi:MAG: Ig-like domain-containing protein [Lachnospiraceae bacterium]